MTTKVDSVSAASSKGYVTAQEIKKKKKEEEQAILTFGLSEDMDYSKKSDRKARKVDLTKKYSQIDVEYYDQKSDEILNDKLSSKQAKGFAKRQVQNEQRLQNFLNTQVFESKEEYDKAVKEQKAGTAYQGKELTYIKDEDVQNWVKKNQNKFYKDGKFSSDLYKQEMAKWVGTDYKMNLDEKSALSAGGDRMSKKDAKKAAKYAGIDVEKDLTWLKKAAVFAGTEAAAAEIGTVTGGIVTGEAKFNSYVEGVHQDGTTEILGEQHSKSNAKSKGRTIGAWAGLIGALPAAIIAAAQAKDNGEKDVFQNSTAEKIVKDPDGILNVTEKDGCRTIARAILALPNLSENEKIATLEYAYGKNTGKTVNRNELIAAYEAAKKINDLPEEPDEPTAPPAPSETSEPTAPPVPSETSEPTTPTAPPVETIQPELTVPTETKTPEPPVYMKVTVENNESIARIAKKYGVSEKELIELNKDQLKYFKSATNCSDDKKYLGFLVGARIKLPAGANEEAVKKNQETNPEKENAKYRKSSKNLDGKLCPERTKTYKPLDDNFRKKNKIRTTDEMLENEGKEDKNLSKKYQHTAKSKNQSSSLRKTSSTPQIKSNKAKANKESYLDTYKKKGLKGVFQRMFE